MTRRKTQYTAGELGNKVTVTSLTVLSPAEHSLKQLRLIVFASQVVDLTV